VEASRRKSRLSGQPSTKRIYHLPTIAVGMQQIQMIYAEGGVAQYRIRKTEGVDEITYYIYFVRDEKGIWKIQQF
jgi:hypothetical protein